MDGGQCVGVLQCPSVWLLYVLSTCLYSLAMALRYHSGFSPQKPSSYVMKTPTATGTGATIKRGMGMTSAGGGENRSKRNEKLPRVRCQGCVARYVQCVMVCVCSGQRSTEQQC